MRNPLPLLPHIPGSSELSQWMFHIVAAALVILVVLLYLRKVSQPQTKKHLPGPWALPLVGNLGIGNEASLFRRSVEWTKIYGPIFRLKNGMANLVIMSDIEHIKKFYTSKNAVFRPSNPVVEELKRSSMGTSKFNGKAWKQNRSFLLSVFEDLGFGKPSIEDHIMEELQDLVSQLSNTAGCLIDVKDYITASVSNIIAAVMFGSRFDTGEAKHKCLVKHLKNILDGSDFGLTVETKPKWLSRVMASLPLNRPEVKRVKRESWLAIRELVREKITEHKNTLNPDFNRDFIDGYLQKMREHHADPTSPFSEENLQEHTAEFLLSGTGPLSMRIFWVLHICAQNPNSVQSKIQKEIDDVVGRHRPPTWDDRKEMPFTLASLKEALRWISVGTIGCSRSVPEDTVIGDYLIPKGSIALINVRAVLRNPMYWSNPDDFDPTRFLSNDGDKLEKKVDAFIPFGVGRRSCPGQSLAITEMFLYIATLLQKFNVFPEYRDHLASMGSAEATADPFVQRLRFVLR